MFLEHKLPEIVCLCGSTRFYETFQRANYDLTMQGVIVLSVGFYRPSPESEAERTRYEHHGENIGCTPEQKIELDKLHMRKIDLADSILVLNVGGYIGESTRNEINYATSLAKNIRYLEEPQAKPETCDHPDFEAKVTVNRLEDTGRFNADVSIRCVACQTPFRFIGLPYGLDLNGAAVSVDGTEARLTIAPKGQVASMLAPDGVGGFTIRKG